MPSIDSDIRIADVHLVYRNQQMIEMLARREDLGKNSTFHRYKYEFLIKEWFHDNWNTVCVPKQAFIICENEETY